MAITKLLSSFLSPVHCVSVTLSKEKGMRHLSSSGYALVILGLISDFILDAYITL